MAGSAPTQAGQAGDTSKLRALDASVMAGPMDTAAAVVDGDTVSMSIAGIGTLVNPVVRAA